MIVSFVISVVDEFHQWYWKSVILTGSADTTSRNAFSRVSVRRLYALLKVSTADSSNSSANSLEI